MEFNRKNIASRLNDVAVLLGVLSWLQPLVWILAPIVQMAIGTAMFGLIAGAISLMIDFGHKRYLGISINLAFLVALSLLWYVGLGV